MLQDVRADVMDVVYRGAVFQSSSSSTGEKDPEDINLNMTSRKFRISIRESSAKANMMDSASAKAKRVVA